MRLLEKYHVEQTFFDGAQLNHFITNNSVGRIFGLTLSYTSQQLLISKGLLVVRGYRVSFANEVLMTFDSYPAQTETQNLILRITVTQEDSSATITTGAITYMDDIETGVGTYDYLLATFIIGQTGIREITPQIRDIKKGSGGSGIGTVIDSVNMTEQALVTLMLTLNDDIYIINTQLYGDEFLFVQKNGQQIGRYAGTGQSFLWDMTNSGWVLASGGDSGGGTHWVSGTLITGTGSNILCYDMTLYGQVRVGDIYRNTDTENTYTCTYKDTEKTAWRFDSCIKGETGDQVFIRYSAYADGTSFTQTWNNSQAYMGVAIGQTAPTLKTGYTWSLFKGTNGLDGLSIYSSTGNLVTSGVATVPLSHISVPTGRTLQASDFILDTAGAMGKVTSVSSGTGVPFVLNGTVEGSYYFNQAVTPDFSGLVFEEGVVCDLLSVTANAQNLSELAVIKLDNYGYAGQYMIAAQRGDEGGAPLVVYATAAMDLTELGFGNLTQGWQNLPASGQLTLTYDITNIYDINTASGWNGTWVGKTAFTPTVTYDFYQILGGSAGTTNYNELTNTPILNIDLTTVTPVANTYYRHTGATDTTYTAGVVYYYDGSAYAAVTGGGGSSVDVVDNLTSTSTTSALSANMGRQLAETGKATVNGKYAVGRNAEATNGYLAILGKATGTGSMAIGGNVSGCSSIAIGIGTGNNIVADYSIGIGTNPGNGRNSVIIGKAINIGYTSSATLVGAYIRARASSYVIAMGAYARADASYSIAIGAGNSESNTTATFGAYGIAIGRYAQAMATKAVAICPNENLTVSVTHAATGAATMSVRNTITDITSIKYLDDNLVWQTVSSAQYSFSDKVITITNIATADTITGKDVKIIYTTAAGVTAQYGIAVGSATLCGSVGGIVYGAYALADGTDNAIAIGYGAISHGGVSVGGSAETGTSYTSSAFGNSAKSFASNGTALGYNATVPESDISTIQLGDSTLSALKCAVQLTVTSDERDKADIENIPSALSFINSLRPVTYVRNPRESYIAETDKHPTYTEETYVDTEEVEEPEKDENGNVIYDTITNEDGATEQVEKRHTVTKEVEKTRRIEVINSNYENYKKYGMCDYDTMAHTAGIHKGSRRRAGLVAQEVQQAIINIYGNDNYADIVNDNLYDFGENSPQGLENKLSIAYNNIMPFLIKAVQELKAEVDELKNK